MFWDGQRQKIVFFKVGLASLHFPPHIAPSTMPLATKTPLGYPVLQYPCHIPPFMLPPAALPKAQVHQEELSIFIALQFLFDH